MIRSVRWLIRCRGCPRVVFSDLCCLYCTPARFPTLLETILGAMQRIIRSKQFSRPFPRFQLMGLQKKDLAAIDRWYLKWPMRLNHKKTTSMVISRFRIYARGYGVLTQIAQYVSGRRQYIFGEKLSVRPTLFRKLWAAKYIELYKYILLLRSKATLGYIYSKKVFFSA